MQEKDSNPRPPGYGPGELATALSCNIQPGNRLTDCITKGE